MCPNKFVRFVMIAGLAGFYNMSNAAVYDFGNLDTVSGSSGSNSGTTIGTYNIGTNHTARYRTDPTVWDEKLPVNSIELMGGLSSSSSANDSARDVRQNRHYKFEQIKRKAKEGRLYSENKRDEDSSRNGASKEDKSPSYDKDHEYSYHDKDDDKGYTPVASAVPEPETYAMILAGLGLIAMTLRRRQEAP